MSELAEGALLPRGRSGAATATSADDVPHDSRQSKRAKEEPGLFGKSSLASRQVKKRQESSKAAAAKKVKLDEEQDLEARRTCTRLTLSRVTPGMKLLGCVIKVGKDRVMLQLCNNLTCTVSLPEVSDEHYEAAARGDAEPPSELKDAVALHTYLPVLVLDTAGGQIKASLRASLLNKSQLLQVPAEQTVALFATVRSVEDHGLVLNLGLKHLQGFLPFSVLGRERDLVGRYCVGQVGVEVQFQVKKAINGVVTVKPASAASQSGSAPVSFAALFPGMNVAVDRLLRDDVVDGGLLVSVPVAAAHVQAVVDWSHRNLEGEDARELNEATVLWVDASSKQVALSFLPHLVHRVARGSAWTPPPTHKIGDLVKLAKVERVHGRVGVVLRASTSDSEGDDVCFFAPSGKLVDAPTSLKKKQQHKKDAAAAAYSAPPAAVVRDKFPLDSLHSLRVLEPNAMEGMWVCSLQDSAVQSGGDSIDLSPGSVVSAQVIKVDIKLGGLLVQVAHSCRGLVTFAHATDSTSTTPEQLAKRFQVGQEVRALVLSHTEHKTYFSLKKSLLDNNTKAGFPLVAEYSPDLVGQVALGTVVKVDAKFGLLVSFFNRVQGIVPLHDLGDKAAKDVSDLYRVGQVVKVKILQVNQELSRMRLSVKTSSTVLGAESARHDQQQQPRMEEEDPILVPLGTVITSSSNNNNNNSHHADSVLVEFTRNGAQLRGSLHKLQLSDFPERCEQLFRALRPGVKLRNFLVLDSSRHPVVLSLKPELIAQAKRNNLPSQLAQVSLDRVYSCVVSNNQEFGTFVRLAGGLTGFVPRANQDERQLQQPPAPQSTVRVLITQVDEEKKRIVCSIKPSAVGGFASYLSAKLATSPHRAELAKVMKALHNSAPTKFVVTRQVGNAGVALDVVVVVEEEEEAEDNKGLPSGFSAYCALEHCPTAAGGVLPAVGAELEFASCAVLAVDFDSKVVDVSARKALLGAVWRLPETSTEPDEDEKEAAAASNELHQLLDVEVELCKPEYCVVSYNSGSGTRVLALLSLVSFNQPTPAGVSIRFGTRMRALAPRHLAVLERSSAVHAQQQQQQQGRARSRSDSLTEFLGPKPSVQLNSVITARVRDIRGCLARLDVRADPANSAIAKIKLAVLHSCDVLDPPVVAATAAMGATGGGAFGSLSVGDAVECKVVEICQQTKTVYLSQRPSVMASREDQDDVFAWTTAEEPPRLPQADKEYDAWVEEVTSNGVFVSLSRHVRAFCSATMVSDDLAVLDELFNNTYKGKTQHILPVGQPVRVRVLDVDAAHKRVNVKMLW